MWEIPISVFIVCLTSLIKFYHDKYSDNHKDHLIAEEMALSMRDLCKKNESLEAEMADMKKKVDALSLKAGFKL